MYNPAVIFDHYRRLTIAAICAFFVGGSVYYALELLWRGHSHITMWFCGAVCMLGIFFIEWCHAEKPLLLRTLLCLRHTVSLIWRLLPCIRHCCPIFHRSGCFSLKQYLIS